MHTRRLSDYLVRYALLIASMTSVLVVAMIFAFLFREALPFAKDPGMGSLLNTRWQQTNTGASYGLGPLITGSLLVTFLGTLVALPFGIGGAVYIAEIAGPREKEFLKPFIELIAAIPSVVLGFFGLIVLGPALKTVLGLDSSLNALNGALLLALMAVPTIITISEDAIRSVPIAYKEASMALGATRLQTIFKVTVPAAMSGIVAAVMLGMGRIVGETMVVVMVTGNAAAMTLSPVESVRTMTATIVAEMGETSYGSTHYRALFWVGIVLLLMTFCINLVAQRVLKKYQRA